MSNYEVKKDCFGYCKESNGCSVLDKLYCKKSKCGFYKTVKQFKDGIAKYGFVTNFCK